MFRNVLIPNEKKLYIAKHYFDEDFKPLTTRSRNFDRGQKHFSMNVLFCPSCKMMHPVFRTLCKDGKYMFTEPEYPLAFYAKWDSPASLPDARSEWANEYKMVCPACGEDLNKYPLVFLDKTTVHSSKSRTLKSIRIFDTVDDKVTAAVFMVYYYPNTIGGKLAVIPMRQRIVFNCKTGMTYILQARDLKGNHPKFDTSPAIYNATLGGEFDCQTQIMTITNNKTVVAELAKELLKYHGGKKEQLTLAGDFSDTTFSMLTTYNSIPYFSYNFYYTVAQIISVQCGGAKKERDKLTYKLRTIKERYEQGDPEEFKRYLFKGTKLEVKKSIRKELFSNPMIADCYKLATRLGFKNHDVIRQLITKAIGFLCLLNMEYAKATPEEQKCIRQFVKALIKAKGETGAYKTLAGIVSRSNPFATMSEIDYQAIKGYVVDTALMYVVFKKKKMLKKDYLKGDLLKIHDNLAKDYQKVKASNRKIEYSKELFDLNDTIDGFRFSLAVDTYELIDIGQEMHICVGSYGDRAVSGRLVIVKMTKDGQYVGCIELSSNGKRMNQAKACFNNMLQEKKAEVLKKWVEAHEIDTTGCYDYFHIARGDIEYDDDKIYQNHYDYANYGIGDVHRDAMRMINEA